MPVFDGFLVKATKTYFEQGSMELTENPLDVALSGPGFFQIETPQGMRYTRNGSFTLNSQGEIVNQDGHPVVGGVAIPPETVAVTITEDGRILADNVELGQLEIVEFADPNVLAKEGADNFVPKVAGLEPEAAEETLIHQGYLEKSNVDVVTESVNMIDTVRTYEVFRRSSNHSRKRTKRASMKLDAWYNRG